MKHFKRIAQGIDVQPYIDEIAAHREMFESDSSRQQGIPAQKETKAVLLFGVDVGDADRSQLDYAWLDTQSRHRRALRYRGCPTPESEILSTSSQYVRDLCNEMKGVPGRAVVAHLSPDGRIYPHTDDSLYWLMRDRYHLVVKAGEKGTWFRAGDEEAHMRQGELWWFDPTVEHEAHNVSGETRIHFVIDILSRHSLGTYLVRAKRSPLRTVWRTGGSLLKHLGPLRPAPAAAAD